jgi:hypothetical protein
VADILDTLFQPVKDSSSPAIIEAVDEAMRTYDNAPESEPKLTSPCEVQEAIKGLKTDKPPAPNGVPNCALMHLPKRAKTLIAKLFNAVLRRQNFPPVWKHNHSEAGKPHAAFFSNAH